MRATSENPSIPDVPFRSQAQRRFLYSQHPEIAQRFADETPKGKKLPERVKSPAPTLADKLARQPLARNERIIPKRAKMHPAMEDAHAAFHRLHGGKFARNAGRGFKKKSA